MFYIHLYFRSQDIEVVLLSHYKLCNSTSTVFKSSFPHSNIDYIIISVYGHLMILNDSHYPWIPYL